MTALRGIAGWALLALAASGCSSLIPRDLPEESPPLAAMEEPLALHAEPDDEADRLALSPGGFTGVEVRDARSSLDEGDGDPSGVLVRRVIDNSPGDVAGIEEGDLLLEATDGDGTVHPIAWPSQWTEIETGAEPGSVLDVLVDRAGREHRATLHVIPRVRPRDRRDAQRLREEDRVGVVLRTATEVEARRVGLAAGGGAVVVGLSRGSPWRSCGLVFGDLLTAVDGEPVAHPQVVLNAIRDAEEDGHVLVDFVRDGAAYTVEAPVSRRAQEIHEVSIPLLFRYESDRGSTELSLLLGLIQHETTQAAWKWRLLWLIRFSGGDADALAGAEEDDA